MMPISKHQRQYLQSHKICLIRNYEKIRLAEIKFGDKLEKALTPWVDQLQPGSNQPVDLFDEDPGFVQRARLAQIFYELLFTVISAKERNRFLCESFMRLPPKQKFPLIYSQHMEGQKLLDLTIIGKKIVRGEYLDFYSLEKDIATVIRTFTQAFENDNPGILDTVKKIKKLYLQAVIKAFMQLEPFIINGMQPLKKPDSFVEDEIRCICGNYNEEGFMVQCESCLAWQHGDCVGVRSNDSLIESPHKLKASMGKIQLMSFPGSCETSTERGGDKTFGGSTNQLHASDSGEPYHCEKCSPRDVNLEIRDHSVNHPDKEHYLSFVREDGFVVRKNDTVYVLRATDESTQNDTHPELSGNEKKIKTELAKGAYKTAGPLVPSNCDIFRVEALFTDAGDKKVFGHYYFRPCETFHEPTRKFYPNEILRSPAVAYINLDSIHGQCWVMDPDTFCEGRPIGIGVKEEHMYICEYRVDKKGRYFNRIKGKSQIICTRPAAFQRFETCLKIQRNFYPHGPPQLEIKPKASFTPGPGRLKQGRTTKADGTHGARAFTPLDAIVKLKEKRKRLHLVLDCLHRRSVHINEPKCRNYAQGYHNWRTAFHRMPSLPQLK